jgi:uncharacterized protein DUF3800
VYQDAPRKGNVSFPLEAGIRPDLEYLDNLWWSLHHSESKDCVVLGLTSYFDDSGTDELSAITAIGGPVMSRIQFRAFKARWDKLLIEYRVPQPLHMQDFVRPHGKHVGMLKEMKLSLFQDVSKLINSHKLYSLSVSIPQVDFRTVLSPEICKTFAGPYALAFACGAIMHRLIGHRANHQTAIAYLIDEGSAYPEQLLAAHLAIANMERSRNEFRYTGAIGFDSDDRVPALQVADVIAWSARRREIDKDKTLRDEFEPLLEVLSENKPFHLHTPVDLDGIEAFARPIIKWITTTGTPPPPPPRLR